MVNANQMLALRCAKYMAPLNEFLIATGKESNYDQVEGP